MAGKIVTILPDIIDIEFPKNEMPALGTIVKTESGSVLSCESILNDKTIRAAVIFQENKMKVSEKVTSTKKPLHAPVGSKALGRIFNVLGQPLDQKPLPVGLKTVPVEVFKPQEKGFQTKSKVLETGIKVIDFFIPIVQGDKIGLFGGAGVGKTLIIKELINNVTKAKSSRDAVSILTGIGERSREGEELFRELTESKLISKVMLYFAQMNEMPGARMKVIYPAITSAEYFRDQEKKDVLMFIDNIYRFTQAGAELSSSLGRIPSQSGYQPTLMTEISNVQERLSNSKHGTITSFETVFVPADDITDPAAVAVFSHLDGSLVLDRKIASAGRYPAIDPLQSSSNNAQISLIGARHHKVLLIAKKYMQRYEELEDLLAILGTDGISTDDLAIVEKARQLQAYFTQNFFTAKELTQTPGDFIPLEVTISSVEAIIDGKLKGIEPSKLLYISDARDFIGDVEKEVEVKEPTRAERKLMVKKQKRIKKELKSKKSTKSNDKK